MYTNDLFADCIAKLKNHATLVSAGIPSDQAGKIAFGDEFEQDVKIVNKIEEKNKDDKEI